MIIIKEHREFLEGDAVVLAEGTIPRLRMNLPVPAGRCQLGRY